MVVHYGRFEFISEYSIETIAKKNETTPENVFLLYQKAILNAFEKYQDENFEFVAVDPVAFETYKKYIKYDEGKFKGKKYNTVNLKEFSDDNFTKFLEGQGADFVIFITWYKIKKESFTRGGRVDKRKKYSGHYIDFDLFNLFKQRIIGLGRVKAESDVPNDLEASYELLRLKELESAYKNFIGKVVEQLNNPIEN